MATLTFTLPDGEKELIEDRADEEGITTAEFVRTRFRAGWRLWDAGGTFNMQEVQQRLDQEEETQ
jgi:hypothetical protein